MLSQNNTVFLIKKADEDSDIENETNTTNKEEESKFTF